MAKKIGLDSKKAKEFLKQKGERVGLGVAGVLTLLILVLAFLGISTRPPASANAPTWGEAINNAADKLKREIDTSPANVGKIDMKLTQETPFTLIKPWVPFEDPSLTVDNKRRSPLMVKCPDGQGDIQVVTFLAPALRYQPDERGRQYSVIDIPNKPASMALEGRRMVIVMAGFPVNDQLNEFVTALQAGTAEKLLAGEDAPRVLGLDVFRTEYKDGADDRENAMPLYLWKNNKIEVAKHLDGFFKQMVIDEENGKRVGDAAGPNMATPVPLLATINGAPRYEKVVLKAIEVAEEPSVPKTKPGTLPDKDKGGFNIPPGGKKPPPFGNKPPEKEAPDNKTTLAEVPRELHERLTGNYNVFDPLGGLLTAPIEEKEKGDPKKKKGPKTKQKPPQPPPFMKEKPGKEDDKKLDGQPITATDASRLLIRFLDVDVEPGKTYRYHFRVRFANPNYGKSTEVSALDLSKSKELPGGEWTSTAPVTIPQESFIYAVDQLEICKHITKDKMVSSPKAILDGADVGTNHNPAEMTAVQIHRWINRFQAEDGADRHIGAWAIAERLLIKRGDLVGRKKVVVEIPEWYDNKNKFDLGTFAVGKTVKPVKGTPVNFLLDETKVPVLVDFQGGKNIEEGATELLLVGADGKLSVRNSRVDSDPRSPVGQERLRHYNEWRHRVEDLRAGRSGGINPIPGGKTPN